MFTVRSIDTYGGQFTDALPVEDPETEIAAATHNRMAEDVAQVAGTSKKFTVTWQTLAGAGVVSAANVSVRSHYGTGSAAKPTITRGATAGLYSVVFAASYVDGIAATETTSFANVHGWVESITVFGVVQGRRNGTTIDVQIFDAAGAATDLPLGTVVGIEVG